MSRDSYQLAIRDSWSSLKNLQCDESHAYCWMDCLELPSSCVLDSTLQCINSESKPCCTDTITTNCEAMDSSCHWQCNTTEYGFCNGQGTDMYMKGFTVSYTWSMLLLISWCRWVGMVRMPVWSSCSRAGSLIQEQSLYLPVLVLFC